MQKQKYRDIALDNLMYTWLRVQARSSIRRGILAGLIGKGWGIWQGYTGSCGWHWMHLVHSQTYVPKIAHVK